MPTLIVEDGTGVANANSYTALANARAFADSRGLSLPTDDDEACLSLIQGFDYVESFRSRFGGQKATCTQSTQFPRKGLCIDGCVVAENAIPFELQQAQIIAASLQSQDTALFVNGNGRETQMERVEGAVSVSYFENGDTSAQPHFEQIMRLLTSMFRSSQKGGGAKGILIGVRI